LTRSPSVRDTAGKYRSGFNSSSMQSSARSSGFHRDFPGRGIQCVFVGENRVSRK
jgi:hypothetical protein